MKSLRWMVVPVLGLSALGLSALGLAGCPETTSAGDAGRDAQESVDAGSLDSGVAPDAVGLDAPLLLDAPTLTDAPRADAATVPTDAGMCMDLPPEPSRPVEVVCSPCRPPGPGGGGVGGECTTDADCTTGSNGRCLFGRAGAFCSYDTCFRDSDCAADQACLCDASGGGNACVPAGCRTNNDCGPGLACSPTFGSCGHYFGFIGFECHTAADECATDADCGAGYCAFDPALAHWACSMAECVG
ncbi:MAG: hypothetical protein K1X94_15310 [Sandaracinaceae bacterium]|nr:hypothetical protein [Sandaracinaceae bacterium]